MLSPKEDTLVKVAVEEFAKGKTFYSFTGLAPTKKTTAHFQRNEFARQLAEQFDLPGLNARDWDDFFTLPAKRIKKAASLF